MTDTVFLTGASGFIAKHVVLILLRAGYRVRGSVRSPGKGREVEALVAKEGLDASAFETRVLDLDRDDGWSEAALGCRFLVHTASPFPGARSRDGSDLVAVARGGTLRALEAARRAGCERVVLTSSVAAMFYGRRVPADHVYGEADFTDPDAPGVSPYAASKVVAEQAARAFCESNGLPLATVNPVLVFGPLSDPVMGTSVRLLDMMMRGRVPLVPDVTVGLCDVRDVADVHLAALQAPGAPGRRFIVSSGNRSLLDVSAVIARAHPELRRRLPHRRLPRFVVGAAALVSSQGRMLMGEIGREKRLDTSPMKEVLHQSPRSPEEAILSCADSIMRFHPR